jgi:hypothetical protein
MSSALKAGLLHVSRLKNGVPSTIRCRGPELRALRRLQRDYGASGAYVFSTERRGPLTDSGVRKIVARAGKEARFSFPVHPHMLRQACGYKLANEGTTRGRSSTTSATGTSSTRSATPTWRPIGSETSGETNGWPLTISVPPSSTCEVVALPLNYPGGFVHHERSGSVYNGFPRLRDPNLRDYAIQTVLMLTNSLMPYSDISRP